MSSDLPEATCLPILRSFLDTLPGMVALKDRSLRFIACNGSFAAFFGRDREWILGRTSQDLFPAEQADKSRMDDERVLRTCQAMESVEGIALEGRESWLRIHRSPYRDGKGVTAGIVLSLQDITDIRNEARDHFESGERYRQIVENITDGLVIHDLKGRILDVNDQATKITGFSRSELLTMNLGRAGHETEATHVLQRLAQKGHAMFETEITRRDGTRISISISTKMVSSEGEGRAQAFIRDITPLKVVEDAFRRTSDRFRNVVEASPMGIHMYRLEDGDRLVFTGANEAADRILGVDNSQFIGKTIEKAFPSLVGTEVPHRYRRACTHGEAWHTNQVTYEDDRIRGAFDVYAFPIGPGEMAVLFLDITEQARADRALRTSEANYRAIVDNAALGIVKTDLNGKILDVNPAFQKMTGYPADELAGLYVHQLTDPDENTEEETREVQEAILGKRETLHRVKRYRRKDGSTLLGALTVSTLKSPDGVPQYVLGLVEDVTDRFKNEEQLLRLAAAVEQVDQAVFITDFDRNLLYANPAFETLTGYRISEMLGQKPDLLLPDNNAPELIQEMIDTVQKKGRTWRGRLVNVRKDGTRFISDSFLANIRDKEGRPVSVMAIVRDITDQVEHETQIQRLATAVDQVADGLMVLDTETRILYANRAFERITGYTETEVLGRTPAFLGPDDAATARYFNEQVIPLLLQGETWRGPQALRRKDGSLSISESVLSPVRDASGRLINYVSSIRDISEQMKQEEEIRLLAAAMEQLDEGVMITDAHRVIQYVNPAFERITSYRREECVGRTPEFLVPPEIAPDIFRSMGEKLMTHGNWTGRFLSVRKDGTLFTSEASISTAYDAQKRPAHGITIMRDITEQLRAEEETLRLATAFNQTGEAIMVLDVEGNIQFVNPAFERITGYTREEALGKTPAFLLDPVQSQDFLIQVGACIQSGRSWSGRTRNIRKDGSHLEVEAAVSPVMDALGRPINLISILRDITEENALQERLQQSQKMEAIGQLAGGVAHDFNNLLAPILGYVQMLLMKLPADDPCRLDLQAIEKAAYRGRDLSRQLLTFSRKQVVEMRPVTLLEVLEGFQRILRRTLREDIELKIQPNASTPILADAAQLELVLMNLVINAQDAMPNGGAIMVETQDVLLDEAYALRHPGVRPGPHVMLSVSDTGTGMSAELQKHIFEPFYTTKEKDRGTGLGLATVYGIVRQHGATISVYSEPGRGTTFRIHFPCTDERLAVAPTPVPTPLPPNTRGHETILVAEDEEAVRTMVVAALERFGYTVVVARDPEEALKLAATVRPLHLLLTDVIMPGMNGRDLHMKMKGILPSLKVVFMSGYTQNIIAHHGVLESGVLLLQKPFTLEALARKIREALDAP